MKQCMKSTQTCQKVKAIFFFLLFYSEANWCGNCSDDLCSSHSQALAWISYHQNQSEACIHHRPIPGPWRLHGVWDSQLCRGIAHKDPMVRDRALFSLTMWGKKMAAMALLKRLCSQVYKINKGQRGHLNAPDTLTLHCIEKKWYAIRGIQKSGDSRFQNLLWLLSAKDKQECDLFPYEKCNHHGDCFFCSTFFCALNQYFQTVFLSTLVPRVVNSVPLIQGSLNMWWI